VGEVGENVVAAVNGAELRVTEDLMHAAQEHPTLDALNSAAAPHQARSESH